MGFEIFIYILRWVTKLLGKICDLPPVHPSSYFMTSPLVLQIFVLTDLDIQLLITFSLTAVHRNNNCPRWKTGMTSFWTTLLGEENVVHSCRTHERIKLSRKIYSSVRGFTANKVLWCSGPPRAWRGPGANFFRGPISKCFSDNNKSRELFRENIFPHGYVVIAFQRLYLNFSISFFPKKQISCPFRGNISPKKWLGPDKKFLGAPRTWGPRAICPLPPPPPLGGPDGV